jgi:hypothetical protein
LVAPVVDGPVEMVFRFYPKGPRKNNFTFRPTADVAHALARAASTLVSTPWNAGQRSVEKSLDAARLSACATISAGHLLLRGS